MAKIKDFFYHFHLLSGSSRKSLSEYYTFIELNNTPFCPTAVSKFTIKQQLFLAVVELAPSIS
jgi:hypothetical protein